MALGERRGTPWRGLQSISGRTQGDRQPPHTNTHALFRFTNMHYIYGRKPEHTGASGWFEPRTFEATLVTVLGYFEIGDG